ncbi:MAG TPA: hypothetical protein DCZ92_12845 [Elusimicrobia bacterium]|nr:hypothetical protein [Elusimicrobiota bacterium]
MPTPRPPEESYWKYAQIGIQLAVTVLLGFWAGYEMDGRFGTSPWLMLSGAAAGLAAGFYLLVKELYRKDGQ